MNDTLATAYQLIGDYADGLYLESNVYPGSTRSDLDHALYVAKNKENYATHPDGEAIKNTAVTDLRKVAARKKPTSRVEHTPQQLQEITQAMTDLADYLAA